MSNNATTENTKELHLLEQGKRGALRVIFSRTGIVLLLFLAGLGLVLLSALKLSRWLPEIIGIAVVFQLAVILVLVNSDMEANGKLTWMMVMSVLPVVGPLFYIYTRLDPGSLSLRKRLRENRYEGHKYLPENSAVLKALEEESPSSAQIAKYLVSAGNYPVFNNTGVTYYPLGEQAWAAMLEDLKKAERFIFLEYFIIEEGKMWGEMLEILSEKASKGVDIRVLYDGTNEFSTLPRDYPERLKMLDIRGRAFAPMTPFLSTLYNYRDHRKILVIDGQVAYNGGINLADEYINEVVRFGHWKDTAVRLEGPAVKSFTDMFLEMWSVYGRTEDDRSYLETEAVRTQHKGYVIPFGYNPMDREKTGENVYIDFLYRANRYVHIMSPYLILDDALLTALKSTAKKGVDVKLIMPGIPDKKGVYFLARSYFPFLIEAGVKIYTYTPGFVHAKVFVSDDNKACVGTINLDYRSLYHHFECATWMYDTECIADVEADFTETLKQCKRVTLDELSEDGSIKRLTGSILRLLAPLL